MLQSPLYWVKDIVPLRLALMARPRGGDDLEDEVRSWRESGLDTVVSLLESAEVRELELKLEASFCARHGIDFQSYPITDRGTPSLKRKAHEIIDLLHGQLLNGKAVAIHCRAGIGRTGLIAGCLLHLVGVQRTDIFRVLSRARGVAVPDTTEQVHWVEAFASERRSAA
jgi:protein-tyrosine phosphatase